MTTSESGTENPGTVAGDHKDSNLWKIIEFIGKVSGISALVGALGRLINLPDNITNAAFIVSVVGLTIALLTSEQFSRLLKRLLPIICIILGVLLAWLMLIKEDPWFEWTSKVSASVARCKGNGDYCLAVDLSKHGIPNPLFDPNNALISDKIANDLKAGTYLMHNPDVFNMLDRRIGIKAHFLGTGFALPWSTTDFKSARMAEYLVPNQPNTHENALAWQLKPRSFFLYNLTVKEIVMGRMPADSNLPESFPSTEKVGRLLPLIQKAFDSPTAPPPVVRFQQFTQAPSAHFGKKDAIRVFFLNLRAVWDMKLIDAVKASGHVNDTEIGDKPLYIWVYLPIESDEAVPATWDEIIPRLKDWIPKGQ